MRLRNIAALAILAIGVALAGCGRGNAERCAEDGPLTMLAPLLQAHQQLDRAVDRCYRPEPFPSDRHRVEYHLGRASVRASPNISDRLWKSGLARTLALPKRSSTR